MVDDILDKIVVPDSKSTKGNVFKKEKEEEEKEVKKERHKHHIHEKKEVFRKEEFDKRKPVTFNIKAPNFKAPGWTERGIFIIIILVLVYFAFFKNINVDLGLDGVFGGDVQPLVVKETEEVTENTGEEITEEETEATETTEVVEEVEEEPELSGEITFTLDDVITEKYDTGVSKITGFIFNIDNQKQEFDAKLLYYAYDGYSPAAWITKPRGEEFYVIPIGSTTKNVDTSIVFTNTYDKTMKFELIDINNDETIANITKTVEIQ